MSRLQRRLLSHADARSTLGPRDRYSQTLLHSGGVFFQSRDAPRRRPAERHPGGGGPSAILQASTQRTARWLAPADARFSSREQQFLPADCRATYSRPPARCSAPCRARSPPTPSPSLRRRHGIHGERLTGGQRRCADRLACSFPIALHLSYPYAPGENSPTTVSHLLTCSSQRRRRARRSQQH